MKLARIRIIKGIVTIWKNEWKEIRKWKKNEKLIGA
jgi:hypothetical protein